MRRNLEAARDAGVNIAFVGANNVYRKIRFEDSPNGPTRRQVNYRSKVDPIAASTPREATVEWRAPPSNEPESSLTGSYYECNPVKADLVVGDASAWPWTRTGAGSGEIWPAAVDTEYDRVTPGVPTPANIQILAHSPVTCRGKRSYADMTYYTAASGAGVFTAGTFGLIKPLSFDCAHASSPPWVCHLQAMVTNVINAFAEGPSAHGHPAKGNSQSFGIRLTKP